MVNVSEASVEDQFIDTRGIFTARKRSLRRLCFHRCLSVHRGGGLGICPGGLCPGGSLSRGMYVMETPHTVISGWYASYWNAFMLSISKTFKGFIYLVKKINCLWFWRRTPQKSLIKMKTEVCEYDVCITFIKFTPPIIFSKQPWLDETIFLIFF